jgi:hypothetical protein
MLEGWSALAFAAGHTNRIKLGTLVTGVTYHSPGLLVKTATTLDVLSHGRAYLGIGAAWNEQEHRGLGVPFPPVAQRFERLEETLQIALQMWAGDEQPYEGKHYHLDRPLNSPQAVQKPHPPILIGVAQRATSSGPIGSTSHFTPIASLLTTSWAWFQDGMRQITQSRPRPCSREITSRCATRGQSRKVSRFCPHTWFWLAFGDEVMCDRIENKRSSLISSHGAFF